MLKINTVYYEIQCYTSLDLVATVKGDALVNAIPLKKVKKKKLIHTETLMRYIDIKERGKQISAVQRAKIFWSVIIISGPLKDNYSEECSNSYKK